MTDSSQQPIFRVDKYQAYEEEAVLFEQYSILMYGSEKTMLHSSRNGAAQ